MTLSNRTFGVEIECHMPVGYTHFALSAALRDRGFPNRVARYGAAIASYWKVQPDNSTGYQGVELVSPILSGETGITEVRRMAEALTAIGCTVSVKTGLHVHFGASDFDLPAIKRLTKMYVWFESFFDHIMPASRRATNNQYIKSNRADFGGYGTDAVNAAFQRLDAVNGLGWAFPGFDRYRKLNITNLQPGKKGTIEFRQHSGTTDPDKIENWIRLLDAFVAKAKVTRIRPRRVERDLTPVEEMRQLFDMIEVEKPVRTFYMNRRKAIAAAEKRGEAIAA